MSKRDDYYDFLGAMEFHVTIDYALFCLKEINDRNNGGFEPKDTPVMVRCLSDIISCKRKMGKSVAKERGLLAVAKIELRKYFITISQDEQIEILKYLNDD